MTLDLNGSSPMANLTEEQKQAYAKQLDAYAEGSSVAVLRDLSADLAMEIERVYGWEALFEVRKLARVLGVARVDEYINGTRPLNPRLVTFSGESKILTNKNESGLAKDKRR
jgi:hypothetical protein